MHPPALWIFDGDSDAPKAKEDRVDEEKGIEKNESDHGKSSRKPEKIFYSIKYYLFTNKIIYV
jgi:hypothetical protein